MTESTSTETRGAPADNQPDNRAGQRRGKRRLLRGRVVNDTASPGRASKTVVVMIERRYRDPVYGKYVKSRSKYHAHDEKEQFRTGDVIEIREGRRFSATKRWVAVRLIERPEQV